MTTFSNKFVALSLSPDQTSSISSLSNPRDTTPSPIATHVTSHVIQQVYLLLVSLLLVYIPPQLEDRLREVNGAANWVGKLNVVCNTSKLTGCARHWFISENLVISAGGGVRLEHAVQYLTIWDLLLSGK